ncbi:MAG TPA: crossover junction endodeoxyribonuclease RuvC, partial [Polyangiales bacterium]|nr:crossover junction endodeoxyribonuclease RuvC [Polyangiales bacterium]
MIVLGIDPGSNRTGWGVVRRDGPRLSYVAAGTIDASKTGELPERLNEIYEALRCVISDHAPNAVAVEDIFHARFAQSALKLGH